MKKNLAVKFGILVLIILTTIVVIACNKGTTLPGDDKTKETPSGEDLPGGNIEELSVISFKDMPTYDPKGLNSFAGSRYVNLKGRGSIGDNLQWLKETAKYEGYSLYKIDSNQIAAVFKIKEESGPEALMTILFAQNEDDLSAGEDMLLWEKTGEAYCIDPGKKYSYADYQSIKKGDPVSDLSAIDGSICYDLQRSEMSGAAFKEYSKAKNADEPVDEKALENRRMIYKLLSDGLLTIEYSFDNQTVVDIKFYSSLSSDTCDFVTINSAAFISKLIKE